MSSKGSIVSVNISREKGTTKAPVEEIILGREGIESDAHSGSWHRQVSLLAQEQIDRFAAEFGRPVGPGEFAENITTQGVDLAGVCLLDRFTAGEALLEVTQIGKECHGTNCAIFREVGRCVMPKEGIFTRVLEGGRVRSGDRIEHLPQDLKVTIITLSDRAKSGQYTDRAGPKVRESLEEMLAGRRWRLAVETDLLPDDAALLRDRLSTARDQGADIVITTGGTGVGPRDIAPDVAVELCDKLIPGIMDHIRLKYGQENPNALLSRSVAGVMSRADGQTLLYTLPGSVRAVAEYLAEITKTLEHLIFMIHGVDVH